MWYELVMQQHFTMKLFVLIFIFGGTSQQETTTRLECTLILTPNSAPNVGNSGDQQ